MTRHHHPFEFSRGQKLRFVGDPGGTVATVTARMDTENGDRYEVVWTWQHVLRCKWFQAQHLTAFEAAPESHT